MAVFGRAEGEKVKVLIKIPFGRDRENLIVALANADYKVRVKKNKNQL